ncbi:hypothetical protein ACFOYW_15160 [Gryllotalpicola reticulitermitis]|uniref:Uncharacterized protein n=1 Tax=Gryllotalpicola reticulitermitis TaxID=1184153 RepID=A0ABV8Q9S5_9MICO
MAELAARHPSVTVSRLVDATLSWGAALVIWLWLGFCFALKQFTVAPVLVPAQQLVSMRRGDPSATNPPQRTYQSVDTRDQAHMASPARGIGSDCIGLEPAGVLAITANPRRSWARHCSSGCGLYDTARTQRHWCTRRRDNRIAVARVHAAGARSGGELFGVACDRREV